MIHPTAIIDPEGSAPIRDGGPYSVIGPGVVIGEGRLSSPMVIKGPTQLC